MKSPYRKLIFNKEKKFIFCKGDTSTNITPIRGQNTHQKRLSSIGNNRRNI